MENRSLPPCSPIRRRSLSPSALMKAAKRGGRILNSRDNNDNSNTLRNMAPKESPRQHRGGNPSPRPPLGLSPLHNSKNFSNIFSNNRQQSHHRRASSNPLAVITLPEVNKNINSACTVVINDTVTNNISDNVNEDDNSNANDSPAKTPALSSPSSSSSNCEVDGSVYSYANSEDVEFEGVYDSIIPSPTHLLYPSDTGLPYPYVAGFSSRPDDSGSAADSDGDVSGVGEDDESTVALSVSVSVANSSPLAPNQSPMPCSAQSTPRIATFRRELPDTLLQGMSPSGSSQAESPRSSSIGTVTVSAPSSPFMELIYSASASTSETPEIFRIADEETKVTPLIRNAARMSMVSSPFNHSTGSTLQSMTPRNQQQVRAEWWVPRIQTQDKEYSSHNTQQQRRNSMPRNNRSSPQNSLPSMLGESPNNEEDDSVSELESPMLFGNTEYSNFCAGAASNRERSSIGGGGESDIQSQSQATDIQSLKTLPTPTAAAAATSSVHIKRIPVQNEDNAADDDEPLMRIRRCNATDEEDNNVEELDYETDDDYTTIQPAMTPTLSQFASGSALLLSREDIVAAEQDANSSFTPASPPPSTNNALHPGHRAVPMAPGEQDEMERRTPEPPNTPARESYVKNNRLFFRSSVRTPSPKPEDKISSILGMDVPPPLHSPSASFSADPNDPNGPWIPHTECWSGERMEETEISELSCNLGYDLAENGLTNQAPLTTSANTTVGTKSVTEEKRNRRAKELSLFSSWGMLCRLVVIFVLAMAVVVPLVIMLIHNREESQKSINSNAETGPMTLSPVVAPIGITTEAPSSSPTTPKEITNILPTAAPSIFTTTLAPVTSAPTALVMGPATARPTMSPVVPATAFPTPARTASPTSSPTLALASLTANPTLAPAVASPTLPPFTSIWDEDTWTSDAALIDGEGPMWPIDTTADGGSAAPLQLTIFNSLTDPTDASVLEAMVENWDSISSMIDLKVENSPVTSTLAPDSSSLLTDTCVPTLGRIRVCNGKYGTTDTKFFSQIYVQGRKILAATIFENDDFPLLDSLDTTASLQYNLCHELGHALGVFSNPTTGCMVEQLKPALNQMDYLHPDVTDGEQLDQLYGAARRGRGLRGGS